MPFLKAGEYWAGAYFPAQRRCSTSRTVYDLNEAPDRIDEYDGFVQAFVHVADRSGRLQCCANSDRSSSPLQGAFVGVKDIIRVDGLETRAGSELPPHALAGPQATLGAGSHPRNPQDLVRTPGGFSSGGRWILRAFWHHLDLLHEVGYTIRSVALISDMQILHRKLFTFQRFELAQTHSEWWRQYSTIYHPWTAAAICDGQRITAEGQVQSASFSKESNGNG